MNRDLLDRLLLDLDRWDRTVPGPEDVARVAAQAWAETVHGAGARVLLDPLPTVLPWHRFEVTVVRWSADHWITLDGALWMLSEADVRGARAAVAAVACEVGP